MIPKQVVVVGFERRVEQLVFVRYRYLKISLV
jgi:hypothetical protein